MRLRVNIIGCAPGWEDAPMDNGERWGINDNHTVVPNIDVIIDCHNLKRVIKGKEKLGRRNADEVRQHMKLVKKSGVTMYSTSTWKNIPNIKEYPLREIINKFDSDYFGSGPDYAVALALYKGATEIHTYGILMVDADEYFYQRPTFEHWLGVAKGTGCKVEVHDRTHFTPILRVSGGNMYGFNLPQRWKTEELRERS